MPHRIFYSVDLAAWVYGTIEKHRQGASWPRAWVETYREIGGATSSGRESLSDDGGENTVRIGSAQERWFVLQGLREPGTVESLQERNLRNSRYETAAREAAFEQDFAVAGDSTGGEA